MVDYLSLKEYSLRTKRSIASVYRDAEKGLIKITIIDGKKHVIIDDQEKIYTTCEKSEKLDFEKIENNEKEYQDVEIVEETTNIRYELEVFKSSIATIEDMASRLESAKDETIQNLKIENDKKDKIVDNQNEIIKTLSHDNSELRTQIAVRDTEISILEKRLEECEKIISQQNENLIKFNEKVSVVKYLSQVVSKNRKL